MKFIKAVHHNGQRLAAGSDVPEVPVARIREWIDLGCIAPVDPAAAVVYASRLHASIAECSAFLADADADAKAAFALAVGEDVAKLFGIKAPKADPKAKPDAKPEG